MLKQKNKYEEGVSICITAYKTEKYIKETLDSVENQTWFKKNDNWECLIGIDGCENTYNFCKKIMAKYDNHFKFYMMCKNCGTYVTTNTLMTMAKYNGLIRFDSDDIMPNDFIEKIVTTKGNCDYMQYVYKNFNGDNFSGIAKGSIFMTKKVFEEYGGYRPWICAADCDLYVRMASNVKCLKNKHVYFMRRVHSDSLTHSSETSRCSDIRKQYHDFIETQTLKEPKITCVTSDYYEINI